MAFPRVVLLPVVARHPGALQTNGHWHCLERHQAVADDDCLYDSVWKTGKASVRRSSLPILVYGAMLPWQFFANSLSESSNSLITNANMLSKVYFPRIIMPASAVIVSLVDFIISFAILVVLMIWCQFIPSWRIVTLPIFLLLALIASLGSGFWLAALNVKYRDFRYIVPFIVQFGLYISPVGFSTAVVPEQWRLWYSLNPMVGVIDGFRWAILGGSTHIYWPGLLLSTVLTLLVFIFGLRYFRKTERVFADVI
ncbi:MAG: ABC-transporter involved in LPS biosynthesis Wzm [Candidatus Brocadia fulgida]|uniref:ABC-transporter involved in LPS biosynthesis Wzm n=1 Tax=Candidatus Brocadia fulgida TaxID=380242 RepID=A0A0M2UQD6_9BACT|nr:MAG: ABC-transporter involved in LPS biosynthesis Wzm [Candidatus Brocadia fulgida]